MDGYLRNEKQKIEELLQYFPAVLILGVRQCGKTSLSKACRPEWSYFDLENLKDRTFIESDYDFFFKEYPEHLIIDEAQELPQLFKNLRGVIDQKRDQKGRFILTGSSSPELIQLASDSLAGRVGIVRLGTLKMNEQRRARLSAFYSILDAPLSKNSISDFNNIEAKEFDVLPHFLKGGYPEPVLKLDERGHLLWMQNYFDTYINRDIRKLFPRLDIVKYQRFVQMLSELSGTVINRAQLGQSIDVNEVSIRDYLDIADKTFVWRVIPSYEKSKSKSLIKMPKGILRDSGLCHFLGDIHTREQLIRSPKVGQNFEAFVIEEILKGLECHMTGRWSYSYYRTKHGAEVDLILEGPFGTLPIEIKFSSSTDPRKLSSLKRFLDQENLPVGVVVNLGERIQKLTDQIIQIPAWAI